MKKRELDTLPVFGAAGEPGDPFYLGNFTVRKSSHSPSTEQDPVLVTDAILHGEPIMWREIVHW